MGKRVLALILSLTLAFSAFTTAAFAETTDTSTKDSNFVTLDNVDHTGADPTFSNGTMSLSVPGTVTYDIAGCGFTAFTASVSKASSSFGPPGGGSSSVSLKVTAYAKDGSVIGQFENSSLTSTAVDVNVGLLKDSRTAVKLVIAATSSSTSSFGPTPTVTFTDAGLEIDPADAVKLHKITAAAEDSILALNAAAHISTTGKLVNGDAVTGTGLSTTYSSDNESVATVDADGTVTAKGNGVATIEVSSKLATDSAGAAAKTAYVYIVCGTGEGTSSWALKSPTADKVKILFFLAGDKTLHYLVYSGDKVVVGVSPVGIQTSKGDFSSGLTFDTRTDSAQIKTNYSMVSGKKSTYEDYANESTFSFNSGAFKVVARAYDDGFAFRYVIDGANSMAISSESTGYQVPADSTCVHSSYSNSYDNQFATEDISMVSGSQTIPFLYTTKDNVSVMLMEAEYNTDYVGTMLKAGTNGMMNVSYTAEQTGDIICDSKTLTFTSPWRCAAVGSYKDIVETELFENLNAANTVSDTSWITPGATTWTWLNGEGCSSGDIYMKYIDLAAEMGWKYVLLDEGWQPSVGGAYSGYYAWFQTVCQHAVDKGVGLLVWTNYSLVNTADTVKKIDTWVNASKVTKADGSTEAAIKGIKADFFNSEAQNVMQGYKRIIDECVKLNLVVNFHGTNKPAGERRTYPNLIAKESIYGNEHSGVLAEQNCLLPLTRAVVGPADFTPLLYDDGSDHVSTNQLSALAVLLECGIPCYADTAEHYRASQLYSWYKDMPAAWEDTKLLDADLGKYVAEARKSRVTDIANGAAEWYASAICTDARNAAFNLSFLTPGKTYYAWIYQDGYTNDDVLVSCKQVTSTDTLTVPMNKNGGCNVKFTTSKPSDSSSITLDKTSETLEQGKNVKLTATLSDEKANIAYNSVNWTSSNTGVATVSSTGKVTAVGVGTAVITAATGVTGSVKATCTITVKAASYGLADSWTVANSNASNFILNSENSLTLLTEDGNWKPMGGDSSDKNITTAETSGDFTIITDLNYTSSTKSLPAGLIVYDKNGTSSSSGGPGGGFGPGGGSSSKPHVALLRGTTTTTTTSNANDANGVNVTTQKTTTQRTIKLTDGTNSIIVEDQLADIPNIYLKIQRTGNVYTGFYSKDKVTWIPVSTDSASSVTNTDVEDTTGVGVETANGSGRYENAAAVFGNFTLNGTKIAFAKSLGTGSDSGSDSGSSSSSSSSSSSATASTGGSIVTTQNPNGGITATVPTQPDAAPVVSGNHSVMNVTVSKRLYLWGSMGAKLNSVHCVYSVNEFVFSKIEYGAELPQKVCFLLGMGQGMGQKSDFKGSTGIKKTRKA